MPDRRGRGATRRFERNAAILLRTRIRWKEANEVVGFPDIHLSDFQIRDVSRGEPTFSEIFDSNERRELVIVTEIIFGDR